MNSSTIKFKQTEIGEIPENWDIGKLLEHLIIKGRIGWKGLKKSEYMDEGGYAIINGTQLINGTIDWKNVGRIDEGRYKESPEIMLKQGDILMSKDGTIGKTSYIDILSEPATVASGVFVIRNNSTLLDQKYLYYCFLSDFFKNLIYSRIEGAVIPHLYQRDINQLIIPLPPLNEQKQIVSVLSSLDDKIELNQKTIKTLEEIGQTLFKRWFIDFEFPNEKGEPYKSSGGEMVDSELGEISKGWSVKKISDFGKVICGKTPSKDRDEYFNGDTPFIKIPDMHGNMFITETTDSLTKLGADSQSLKYLPKNSICISCIATVGLVSLTSKESQTNQQINSLILNEEYYKEYLFFTLKNSYDFLNNLASGGSATLNMNTQTFSNIEILKPNKEILLSFHENLSPIFEKILNLQNENISIKNTRDSLLPKLLSGKIRV